MSFVVRNFFLTICFILVLLCYICIAERDLLRRLLDSKLKKSFKKLFFQKDFSLDAVFLHLWYGYLQTLFLGLFQSIRFWESSVFGILSFCNLIFQCVFFFKFMKLLCDFFFWQITQSTLDYAARWENVPTLWKKFSASRKFRLRWRSILNFSEGQFYVVFLDSVQKL